MLVGGRLAALAAWVLLGVDAVVVDWDGRVVRGWEVVILVRVGRGIGCRVA